MHPIGFNVENVVESVNETDQVGFGTILLGGFSSLMDGVTTYGQLTINQRLREQFPEQFGPVSTTTSTDAATSESRLSVVNQAQGAFEAAVESVKNANPLILGAVGVGAVAAIVIALKA